MCMCACVRVRVVTGQQRGRMMKGQDARSHAGPGRKVSLAGFLVLKHILVHEDCACADVYVR